MKHFTYIVAFALSLCSVPMWAEISSPEKHHFGSKICTFMQFAIP